jgi:hypothetical protein
LAIFELIGLIIIISSTNTSSTSSCGKSDKPKIKCSYFPISELGFLHSVFSPQLWIFLHQACDLIYIPLEVLKARLV